MMKTKIEAKVVADSTDSNELKVNNNTQFKT